MQLDKNLYDEINDYCKENDIKTRDFIHKILKEAFLREKYGTSPFMKHQEVKPVKKAEEVTEVSVNIPSKVEEKIISNIQNEQKPLIEEVNELISPSEIKSILPEFIQEDNKPRVKKKRTLKS